MVSAEKITETVHRYLELVAGGSADDIADLFADDATVEDPVGDVGGCHGAPPEADPAPIDTTPI